MPHPLLEAFHSLMPDADKAWSDDATTRIQDHMDRRNLVAHAEAQSNALVQHVSDFKQNLISMTHQDPSMTPLALDLVPGAISQIVNKTGHPDADTHAKILTNHIQREIARTGVQSYAIQDKGAATSAMHTYGSLLTDEDKTTLSQFADNMQAARDGDHQAQLVEETKKRQLTSDVQAHSYLSQLADSNGDVSLPHNWLRDMAADVKVLPETKAALWQAHARLQQGDVEASNPHIVTDLVTRLASRADRPSPTEVMSHAGDDLTLADAQHLAAGAFPGNQSSMTQLANTFKQAQKTLASPENGPAGDAAFTRFVNWAMPAARNGAVFDPAHTDYALQGNKMQDFAPRPEDAITAITPPNENRPSLSEIFSGRRSTSN